MSAPPPPSAATPALCVGLGLRTGASAATLHALWQQAQALLRPQWPGASLRPACIAALPHHLQHLALRQWLAPWLADGPAWADAAHPVALLAAPPQALAAQPTHSQSPQALARYGCGSVAEACALWAAGGPGGYSTVGTTRTARLLLPRLIAPDGCATLAVAAMPGQPPAHSSRGQASPASN